MALPSFLDIVSLGQLKILLDGDLVPDLASRKAEALLIYVATTGRSHAREKIANLLWDDRTQQRTMGNLRVLLSSLRKQLDSHLVITRHTVAFRADSPHRLDVRRFEDQLAAARRQLEAAANVTANAAAASAVADALALYTGEFLASFYLRDCQGFMDWVFQERERLHLGVQRARLDLAAVYADLDDVGAGLDQARPAQQADPLDEEPCLLLMRLLALDGRRAAAMTEYEAYRDLLHAEMKIAPSTEIDAVYQSLRQDRFTSQSAMSSTSSHPAAASGIQIQTRQVPVWLEPPQVSGFLGREAELAQLTDWLIEEQCPLVLISGAGGVGKSALAAQTARRHVTEYDGQIWLSLLNAPPLDESLRHLLDYLADEPPPDLPGSLDERLGQLVKLLRARRFLVVLDNWESLLDRGSSTGAFRAGYEAYGQLLEWVASRPHNSTLLLTGREQPVTLSRLIREHPNVRMLTLGGLDLEAGRQLVGQVLPPAEIRAATELVERYSGNPLALKLAAHTIVDVYGSDVEGFLSANSLIFDDIRRVLDQQFDRLGADELATLNWLTVAHEPVTLQEMQRDWMLTGSGATLAERLRSLRQRSLVEQDRQGFFLQNVVMEYNAERLVEQVVQELAQGATHVLQAGALLKAQAKETVRQTQSRLFLQPVAERLLAQWGRVRTEEVIREMVAQLRRDRPLLPGYAVGNLLNLLIHLDADLAGYDFSRLAVWQAYLCETSLPDVDFSRSDLSGSRFSLPFHTINAVAYSADGDWLAAAGGDGAVYLWDGAGDRLARRFSTGAAIVRALAFSPDGTLLASGGDNYRIRLWNLTIPEAHPAFVQTLEGHSGWITDIAIDPSGKHLISAGLDHTIRVWDLAGGEQRASLSGHTDVVNALSISEDGRRLASCSRDGTIRIWALPSGDCLRSLVNPSGPVASVALRPDGKWIAGGSAEGDIWIWVVGDERPIRHLSGHSDVVKALVFGRDGRTLVSGSRDRTVRIWNVPAVRDTGNDTVGDKVSDKSLQVLQGHINGVEAIALRPSSTTIASGGNDRSIRLWDMRSGQTVRSLHGSARWITTLAADPEGGFLVTGEDDETVLIWPIAEAGDAVQPGTRLAGHKGWVKSVAVHPNGQVIASSGDDGVIHLWDVPRAGQRASLPRSWSAHPGWVNAVVFHPEGRLLASGGDDATVRLWDLAQTGADKEVAVLRDHSGWIESVVFHPQGTLLASGGSDKVIRLWQLPSDLTQQEIRPMHVLAGHSGWVQALAFDPQGRLLVSGAFDRTVHIWDVATGALLRVLTGHAAALKAVALSADGRTLASAGWDRTICLWHVDSGKRLRTLKGHEQAVTGLEFLPNGKTLASTGYDATVRLWDISTGECRHVKRVTGRYEGMKITGATGLSVDEIEMLKAQGAVDKLDR